LLRAGKRWPGDREFGIPQAREEVPGMAANRDGQQCTDWTLHPVDPSKEE
jgi:hypothetical protein